MSDSEKTVSSINFDDGERKYLDLDFGDGPEEYLVVDIIEAAGRNYIAVTAEEAFGGEETDLLWYRYDEDEEGEPVLDMIETDEEFALVLDAFARIVDEIDMDEMTDAADAE